MVRKNNKKPAKAITFYEDSPVFEKLDKLKKIYNMGSNTKLIEHIVDMEILKHKI